VLSQNGCQNGVCYIFGGKEHWRAAAPGIRGYVPAASSQSVTWSSTWPPWSFRSKTELMVENALAKKRQKKSQLPSIFHNTHNKTEDRNILLFCCSFTAKNLGSAVISRPQLSSADDRGSECAFRTPLWRKLRIASSKRRRRVSNTIAPRSTNHQFVLKATLPTFVKNRIKESVWDVFLSHIGMGVNRRRALLSWGIGLWDSGPCRFTYY